jgi:hypothetical protein
VRTRLTFLDFALGTTFATIPLTPNYEGTVSCRAMFFHCPNGLRERPVSDGATPAQGSVSPSSVNVGWLMKNSHSLI